LDHTLPPDATAIILKKRKLKRKSLIETSELIKSEKRWYQKPVNELAVQSNIIKGLNLPARGLKGKQ
jgi:hypothetical protein